MRRRQVLAVAAGAVPVGGCRDTTEPTPNRETITADGSDLILLVVGNDTDREQTVHVDVTRDETALLDGTATLDAGDSVKYDTGIESAGQYTLTARADGGPERTLDLSIESYDVRMGSDHSVRLTADGFEVTWEE